jgi:hypothetical protein
VTTTIPSPHAVDYERFLGTDATPCRSAEEREQAEQGSRMLLDGLAAYAPTI